jgi:hypothetical protein
MKRLFLPGTAGVPPNAAYYLHNAPERRRGGSLRAPAGAAYCRIAAALTEPRPIGSGKYLPHLRLLSRAAPFAAVSPLAIASPLAAASPFAAAFPLAAASPLAIARGSVECGNSTRGSLRLTPGYRLPPLPGLGGEPCLQNGLADKKYAALGETLALPGRKFHFRAVLASGS